MLISPSIKHEYGHIELKQHFYFRSKVFVDKCYTFMNDKREWH